MSIFIFIFLLLKFSLNIIVFPFKTAFEHKNGYITEDSKEYNGTHFAIDNFNTKIFTEIKIGNPYQKVKVLLSAGECAFKIGKSTKCIYQDEYLSYYNRNKSSDFNYTPIHSMVDRDFNNEKGSTAEDTIYAYTDIDLKNETIFKNVGFYLGSDTNDKLCGIIGLDMDNIICQRVINIVKDCKSKKYINNYKFILKYNSLNEGLFIIGSELENIIDNFEEKRVFTAQLETAVGVYKFGFLFNKVILGEKNDTILRDIRAEINNNCYFINVDRSYLKLYRASFFEEYLQKKICKLSLYVNDPRLIFSERYYVIECDKEKFKQEDLIKLPKLYLYLGNYFEEKKFVFDYKDLFTETKYKYFFNIIFENTTRSTIELGKVFLKKYPINFNFENNKILEIYDTYYEEEQKGEDGREKPTNNYIVLYFVLIIVLVSVVGVLGFFLGKYLNKMRKKRANELDDDYDYKQDTSIEPEAEQNNNINS